MERGDFHGYHRPQKCISEGMNGLPELEDELSQKPMLLMPTASFDDNPDPHGSSTATNIIAGGGSSGSVMIREQDRYMPIANVIRIMRKVLPSHAKISDDAKETIQECVSEYISFITGEANDRCQREQRKTITAEDVLWAMNKLGFDDYICPLSTYLHRYRELEGDHRGSSLRSDPPCFPKRTIATANPDLASYGTVPAYHHHHPGLFPSSPVAASCASPSTSHHVSRHDDYNAAASTSADDKQFKYHHAS